MLKQSSTFDRYLLPGKSINRKVEKLRVMQYLAIKTLPILIVLLPGLVFGSVEAGSFHEAVSSGDLSQVRALIAPGLDINEQDSSGKSAIHGAVLDGNTELVELLISSGADVNIAVNSKHSIKPFYIPLHEFAPLHIAANSYNQNSLEMAGLLIANGANVNQKTDDGQTPLHFAVRRGDDKLVELLVANGADVNSKDFEDYTPLHNAAWNGRLSIVEMLVNNGADINANAYDNRTPYRCAAKNNHQQVKLYLEKLGAVK